MKDNRSNRLWSLAALLLLFAGHWLFYKVGLFLDYSSRVVVPELVIFFVFYGMTLLDLPPLAPGLWMLAGFAGMTVFYTLTQAHLKQDYILPLTYLAPQLFFLSQYSTLQTRSCLSFSGVWTFLMHIYPWAFLGLILFAGFTGEDGWSQMLSSDGNYSTVTLLLLAAVCFTVIRMGRKAKKGAKQPKADRETASSFVFAVIALLEAVFYFRINCRTPLTFTVPLLWTLDLLLLNAKGHPAVRQLTGRVQEQARSFLG